MGNSDEEDYMSEKFLQNDTKPGLMPKIFLNKHKRVEEAKFKGERCKTKPIKVQEMEKREEKLNTALDESNKGFAMLSRMGFKRGMGLGKEGQGRSEPIPMEIKEGRKGLGKEQEEAKRKQKRMEAHLIMAKRRKAVEENLRGDFKNRVKDKLNERQVSSDLYKSQKACEHLDALKRLEPAHSWSWPKFKVENEEDEDEDEDEDENEEDEPDILTKLEVLTYYLRATHFYCIWCGTAYDSENDLNMECPGDNFDAHEG